MKMGKNINNKNSANQMRVFMKRIRDGRFETSESVERNLTVRDTLKITRDIHNGKVSLNETENRITSYDQPEEEKKFKNNFDNMSVSIKFIELEVYDEFVFWGGTVNGIIQFIYKVTSDESTSGVEFNYLPDFSPDNPENDEIIKRIETYFETFYKYWIENIIDDNSIDNE